MDETAKKNMMPSWVGTYPELQGRDNLQQELELNPNFRRALFRIFNNAGEAAMIENKKQARRLLEAIRLDAYDWVEVWQVKADLLRKIFDPDGIQEQPDIYGEAYGVVRNVMNNFINRVGGTYAEPTGVKGKERFIGRKRTEEKEVFAQEDSSNGAS